MDDDNSIGLKSDKSVGIWVLVIILVALLVWREININDKSQKTVDDYNTSLIDTNNSINNTESIYSRLWYYAKYRHIDHPCTDYFSYSIDSVNVLISQLGYDWQRVLHNSYLCTNYSHSLCDSLKNEIITFQALHFPYFRIIYALHLKEQLWIDNCSADYDSQHGLHNNDIIIFEGGDYILNRNKVYTYNEYQPTLVKYRFKTVRFKPYKKSWDYDASFRIESPSDSAVIHINQTSTHD